VLRDFIGIGGEGGLPFPFPFPGPVFTGDFDAVADGFWTQALQEAGATSPTFWFVRSRLLHVAPEAAPVPRRPPPLV
jgi:hypothetical protein